MERTCADYRLVYTVVTQKLECYIIVEPQLRSLQSNADTA